MKHHRALGQMGERIARRYLHREGYLILATNWRYGRAEVDIIASKGKEWIFLEVKTRSSGLFCEPERAVDIRKQRLLTDAAATYMYEHRYSGEFRFDIISIICRDEWQYGLKHYRDAFFPGF